jgi:hypothetical protein
MKIFAYARLLLASAIAFSVVAAPGIAEARTILLSPVYMLRAPNTTVQQTEAALRRSLAGRHWVVTRDQPGDIEAKLNVRDHSVTAKFAWTPTQVSVTYAGSENMDYKVDGDKIYIDRYYHRWLKYLQKDVVNYSKRALKGDQSSIVESADDKDDKDDEQEPAGK